LPPKKLEEMIEKADKTTTKDGKFFWKKQEKNYKNYLDREMIDTFLQYRGEETEKIGYDRDYFLS
jgi:hypothetical protein